MRKMVASIVDDLDGESAATTTEIILDGQKYTVDLSKKHRADLDRVLKKYLDAAKQPGKLPTPKLPANPDERKSQVALIRQWANDHNLTVPTRGRLPKAIVEQYEAYESNHTVVG